MADPRPESVARRRVRLAGVAAGPLLGIAAWLGAGATDLEMPARVALGLAAWMGTWWITEAVPLAATALLPLVVFPSAGILAPRPAAAPYADPNVFLFLGGFLLALAFERSGLHRRVALLVLATLGGSPRRLLLGFMVATALISMWVSNTATALLMFPIVMAVASQAADGPPNAPSRARDPLPAVLILGVAYAASLGGMATLVGTPPNIIFAGQSARFLPEGQTIGFLQWMLVGAPVAAIMVAFTWAFLAFFRLDPGASSGAAAHAVEARRAELGPLRAQEGVVLAVFLATVAAWVFRTDLVVGPMRLRGWADALGLDVHDGTVAVAAALVLFLVPAGGGQRLLDLAAVRRVPWDVLLLFGGGFALAAGFEATGVDQWLGAVIAGAIALPLPVLLLAVALLMTAGSELASNTALAALVLPVLGAAAQGSGLDPVWLMVPATLAASSGFMLPVATPPNTLAYASGHVQASQMARAGWVLDLVGAVVITTACLILLPLVFGV